jgi:hypothetical protein
MTHSDLVDRAIRWLKSSLHCRVVLSELVAYTESIETPDAIGWVFNRTILVECKTSLSDFYADRKKRSRLHEQPALGVWRFYLTVPGLLSPKNMLKAPGWGFYEVHGKRVVHAGGNEYCNAGEPPFNSDRDSEVALLVSALARIGGEMPKEGG